jgi:hypothetical protein
MFFIAQGQRASRLVMDTHDVERGVLTARVRVAELRSEPCNRYRPESAVPLGEDIRERPLHGAHRGRTSDIAQGRISANFCHIRSTKNHHFPISCREQEPFPRPPASEQSRD